MFIVFTFLCLENYQGNFSHKVFVFFIFSLTTSLSAIKNDCKSDDNYYRLTRKKTPLQVFFTNFPLLYHLPHHLYKYRMRFSHRTLKLWQKLYSHIKGMNTIFYAHDIFPVHPGNTQFSRWEFSGEKRIRKKAFYRVSSVVDL